MKVLRAALLLLNVSAILFLGYIMLSKSQNADQRMLTLAVTVGLILNLIYLIVSAPTGAKEPRLWRLGRLWLDAKESELQRRTDKMSN